MSCLLYLDLSLPVHLGKRIPCRRLPDTGIPMIQGRLAEHKTILSSPLSGIIAATRLSDISHQAPQPHLKAQSVCGHYLRNTFPCRTSYGRSGLRPSLVQGLRPRNAPLQNHRSPTSRAHFSVSAGGHGGGRTPDASPCASMVPRMTGWSSTVAKQFRLFSNQLNRNSHMGVRAAFPTQV